MSTRSKRNVRYKPAPKSYVPVKEREQQPSLMPREKPRPAVFCVLLIVACLVVAAIIVGVLFATHVFNKSSGSTPPSIVLSPSIGINGSYSQVQDTSISLSTFYVVPMASPDPQLCIAACLATSSCTMASATSLLLSAPGFVSGSIQTNSTPGFAAATSAQFPYSCVIGSYEIGTPVSLSRIGFYLDRQPSTLLYDLVPGEYNNATLMYGNNSLSPLSVSLGSAGDCASYCYALAGCTCALFASGACVPYFDCDYMLVNNSATTTMVNVGPTHVQSVPLSFDVTNTSVAPLAPVRGWNSWYCYGLYVNESTVLAAAEYMAANLTSLGYHYIVIDAGWWWSDAEGGVDEGSLNADGYLIPDPVRFPSSVSTQSFAPLAAQIHAMGLLFGIHLMPGVSQYNAALINGTLKSVPVAQPGCSFSPSIIQLDPSMPVNAVWTKSEIQLYAEWGVDFIKLDCVGGGAAMPPGGSLNFQGHLYRDAILASSNPNIVLSLSPGFNSGVDIVRANSRIANYWRVYGDLQNWQSYSEGNINIGVQYIQSYQGISSDLVYGWSYPDMDMFNFGYTSPDLNIYEPNPQLNTAGYTVAQMQSIMTVHCLFRSPIFYGGSLAVVDPVSVGIVSNVELLFAHAYAGNISIVAYNASAFLHMTAQNQALGYTWETATNVGPSTLSITLIPPNGLTCSVYDVWNNYTASSLSGAYNGSALSIPSASTVALRWYACV